MPDPDILSLLAAYWPDRLPRQPNGGRRIVHVRCLCERHADHTPSVAVYTDQQRFKCYALNCEHRGGIREAAQLIAAHYQRHGQSVPPELLDKNLLSKQPVAPKRDSPLSPLRFTTPPYISEVIGKACRYYAECIRECQPALDYLHHRGLSDQTIQNLAIGWGPADVHGLQLSSLLNVDVVHLAASGLINARGRSVMAGRIVFPVYSGGMHSISYMVGRTIRQGCEPRYLGLGSSLAIRSPYRIGHPNHGIIVVEGIMDAAAIVQAGLAANYMIIALLGGGSHRDIDLMAHWLHRRRLPAILLLDRDEAGKKMTANIIQKLSEYKIDVASWHPAHELRAYLDLRRHGFLHLHIDAPSTVKDVADMMQFGGEGKIADAIGGIATRGLQIADHFHGAGAGI